jgi:hypothetical protein
MRRRFFVCMAVIDNPNTIATRKTWNEFRETGLFMFVNTILHAFGWAIAVGVDRETGEVKSCYPIRCKYRGFDGEDQTEMHKKIGTYLKDNADQLEKEAHDA